jgi:hypothetical protein
MSHNKILMFSMLWMLPGLASASEGARIGNILSLGAGSKSAAMSEAFTASCDDPSVMFYNPAGLALQGGSSLMATHAIWFESVGYSAAAYNRAFGKTGVFAVGAQMLNYGKIDSLDNTGAADGTFSPRDSVLSLAWGREMGGGLSAGAAAKYLSTRIDKSAAAFMGDFGGQFRYRGFRSGFAVQNIGTKVKFNDTAESLPVNTRLGLGYELKSFGVYGDANLPESAEAWYALGAEYRAPAAGKVLAVFRAGYSTRAAQARGGKTIPFSFGIGLGMDAYELDYAMTPYGNLGQAHQFTFNMRWGR